jgi:uncharacterized protein (DUF2236 family)
MAEPMADAGLFGPDTLTWRINREGVLLIGGGRALVLQVAHPLVAAGVEQHSNYQEDPWGRLYRTLDVTTRIVFGDSHESREAAERLWNVHGRVNGTTAENGGRHPTGAPYDAHDPELLMWVHATLVDTSILVYDRYVKRLTAEERSRYYLEQKSLAERFGVPLDRQPETYADFTAYFERMVSRELAPTGSLRAVVESVMHPRLPRAVQPLGRPLAEALNLATAGLLPASLRDELALKWGPRREKLLGASDRVLRGVLPLLPAVAREFPMARKAAKRVDAAAA